jgi:hypothetical protein
MFLRKSVNFKWILRRYVLEDIGLPNHIRENINSYIFAKKWEADIVSQ